MLLFILLVFAFFFFLVTNHMFRYAIMHLPSTLYWGLHDIYDYIVHKRYNEFTGFGKIENYIASSSQAFGCGKTLTMVNQVRRIYRLYNNKMVFDYEKKIFVKQKIRVFSNVTFTDIPYIPFVGISQFSNIDEYYKKPYSPYNEVFGSHDIILFAVDEIGHVFNSRDFKNNFSTETLTRLLQVRKNKILWIGTSQRWGLVDKIIRETSSTVTTCRKWWRFILLQEYDAYELENAKNTDIIKPVSSRVWFAFDKDYKSYDTNQLVSDLNKQISQGDIIRTETILNNAGQVYGDMETIPQRHIKFRERKQLR